MLCDNWDRALLALAMGCFLAGVASARAQEPAPGPSIKHVVIADGEEFRIAGEALETRTTLSGGVTWVTLTEGGFLLPPEEVLTEDQRRIVAEYQLAVQAFNRDFAIQRGLTVQPEEID